MRFILISAILCFLFYAPLSRAQDVVIETNCNMLSAQAAEAKNSEADYKPGVDANGKPVAPADLGKPLPPINYPLLVPVTLDVIRYLDEDLPNNMIEPDLAYVTLFEDGRIEYNGVDISEMAKIECTDKPLEPKDPATSKQQAETIEPASGPEKPALPQEVKKPEEPKKEVAKPTPAIKKPATQEAPKQPVIKPEVKKEPEKKSETKVEETPQSRLIEQLRKEQASGVKPGFNNDFKSLIDNVTTTPLPTSQTINAETKNE